MRSSAIRIIDITGLAETAWTTCVPTRAVPAYPSMVVDPFTGTRLAH